MLFVPFFLIERGFQVEFAQPCLADARDRLASVESTPQRLVVETVRGHLARADFASREITGTPKGKPVKLHPQCGRMYELLAGSRFASPPASRRRRCLSPLAFLLVPFPVCVCYFRHCPSREGPT
jgi:hypothetical protein